MSIYSFRNDYSECCHESILEALAATCRVQTPGYGTDSYCEEARDLIRAEIKAPKADVWFIPGGTQTNLIAIAASLRPHEAVIGAATCHIFVHETGSIEATGHKVLVIEDAEGKVRPEGVKKVLAEHEGPHMVKPRMVYLSQSTEVGTIYSKAELKALHDLCKEHDLLLYVDGARMGAALVAPGNDLQLSDFAELCDMFYIGGTKNGAMMGEALVILNPAIQQDFLYLIKQRGAMFAKGRLLGLQFSTLFKDGLFYRLAEHANRMAMRLREGIAALGVRFWVESVTNQQFIVLTEAEAAALLEKYEAETQWKADGLHCLRLVTSWATPEAVIEQFLQDLAAVIEQH